MAHSTNGTIADYLKDHPRMMGALFTMCILLMETGNAAAGCCSSTSGP